ncbi:hypothetical protein OZX67_00075 [Bifidobacterium sp. ESL0728]|uniref:hypothetical protein n=1 Tax=Bifidobacterium sp. ESL0728 TaxID=2983220 RepID=UPI0023F6AF70|nr:hypothetical protein [Bifidobacterium sp. ESL0728]WEV59023.1 hypothetical protein OZX67_00075 [Bifidobacterium sp. ESL0728]
MVNRDFRESTKQKYLQDVSKVCSDQGSGWDNFWDGVGNFPGIGWLINEGIKVFQGQDAYERQLIDINNTTRKQIQQIWTSVNNDANGYMTKFAATGADINSFTAQLKALTDTVSSGGSFTAANINGKLKAGVTDYLNIEKYLAEIARNGLDLNKMGQNPSVAFDAFKAIGNFALDNCPTLKAGDSWTMTVGPGLIITITAKGEADGNGNLTITIPESVFKKQKTLLKDMLSWDKKGVHIDENGGIPDDTQGWVCDKDSESVISDLRNKGHLTESWHRTLDGATESITLDLDVSDPSNPKLNIAEGVKENVNNANASTNVNLQINKLSGWQPGYATERVELNPAQIQEWWDKVRSMVPQIDWDPNAVRAGIVSTAAAIAIWAFIVGVFHIPVPFPAVA